jgi:hypothetical protein
MTSRSSLFFVFALAATLLAFAPARAQDDKGPMGGDEQVGPPEAMMETPYTAAQIASACPVGRKLKLAVEVEGEKPGETVKQFQLLEFKAATPTGATIVATMLDDQGKETGDREESEVSWEELKTHAEFPQARTKRTDGELETPAGKFKCWIYTVAGEPEDPDMGDTVFWFAKELPGPPVKIEARKKDNKSAAYTMTLVENTGSPAPGK